MALIKNNQIKRKITILSSLTISIILVMTLSSYLFNSYMQDNFKTVKTKDLYAKNISISLKDKISAFHRYLLTAMIKNDSKTLNKIELEILNQKIIDDFEKLSKMHIQNNDLELLSSLGKLNVRYKSYYGIIKDFPTDKLSSDKCFDDFVLIDNISQKMFSELNDFVIQNDLRFNDQMAKIDVYMTTMVVLFSVFSLVLLAFFTTFGYLFGQTILKEDIENVE